MIELLKSIKDNYDIFIDTNKIHKLGATTINDIFLINIDNKKYIVKIYNVDGEKQIRNSLYTQKKIYQSLKITADILINKNNELYTKYNDKFYAIQEYIEEQKNTKIDIIEKTSKNLYFLHQELKKLDKTLYKNKKEYSDSTSIKENIEKTKNELEKIKTSQEVKSIFDKLLNKRKNLLEKYKCEYCPNEFQVIHRDIRPGNIIVNNNGIYFIDFDYVAYGDLLFEIGSASMLISDFIIERAKDFVNIYNSYLEKKYKNEEIYKNLLAYYVQSDFPIKLINKVENDALIGFIENRIKCLDFCEKILYY